MITFLIAFFSLIFLLVLHELGHFVLAKKFDVKVEEFGIFYPPKIIGKKIGETIYSLNLIPLGAFVRLYGEQSGSEPRAFAVKPVWQRALILLGGVVSFWIISAILLSIVMGSGFPSAIEDTEDYNLKDVKVQILAVAPDSPAEKAGLKLGDTIKQLTISPENALGDGAGNQQLTVDKVKEVQEFADVHRGKEIVLTIKRGKDIFDVSLIPRISPPEEEGPIGIALTRTAIKKYSPIEAPFQGILTTARLTYFALDGWGVALKNLVSGRPTGVELAGPIGVFSMLDTAASQGVTYFLQFVDIISIYIALFNILPIPPADGGRLIFLLVEKIKGKKFSERLEAKITPVFVFFLIALMILITIKDISKLVIRNP